MFSTHHKITRSGRDDWLDVTMHRDTGLFVDPFLIYEDDDPFWAGAHDEVVNFFNAVLELVAEGLAERWESPHWKKALRLQRRRRKQHEEPRARCVDRFGIGQLRT